MRVRKDDTGRLMGSSRYRLRAARRQVRNRDRGKMREMRLRHRPMQLLGAIPAHCVSTAQQRIYENIVDMRLMMGRRVLGKGRGCEFR